MNLILLREVERIAPGRARLSGPRARHLIDVLNCTPGRELEVGIPDGPKGRGCVERVDDDAVELTYVMQGPTPPRPQVDLILALPRPKALRRLLEHVAALGVSRILLTNSARVEKSYFQSALLEEAEYREHLLAGLEQAACTRVPRLEIFERFRPFVEDQLDGRLGDARRLVAHPGAGRGLSDLALEPTDRVAIAIGPEGGWQAFELDLLQAEGFQAFHIGPRVLRVETACTAILAQLQLLLGG